MPYADPEMNRIRCRARYAAHKEEDKARKKAAYAAADKAIERAKRRAWYEANKERALELERIRQYKARYGITVADYDQMLVRQGWRCAICGADSPRKNPLPGRPYFHKYFAVDHCHATGRVRGLLCVNCNVSLAKVEGWYATHRSRVDEYVANPK